MEIPFGIQGPSLPVYHCCSGSGALARTWLSIGSGLPDPYSGYPPNPGLEKVSQGADDEAEGLGSVLELFTSISMGRGGVGKSDPNEGGGPISLEDPR